MTPQLVDIDFIIDEINAIHKDRLVIIGIDGKNSSGKSSFTDKICKKLPIVVFGIDCYIDNRKNGAYFDKIEYDRLKLHIESIKDLNLKIILEGIFLLQIAEKCELQLDKKIYLKRITNDGIWQDEWICGNILSEEKVMKRILQLEPNPGVGNLDRELFIYHEKYRPIENSDYIVQILQ